MSTSVAVSRKTVVQLTYGTCVFPLTAHTGDTYGCATAVQDSSAVACQHGRLLSRRYVWMQMPAHERRRLRSEAQAHRSPTLVGCAIAVRKDYFHHIGGFDDAMNVWGGENIELAFRTWMCGGQVRSWGGGGGSTYENIPSHSMVKYHGVLKQVNHGQIPWYLEAGKPWYTIQLPYAI